MAGIEEQGQLLVGQGDLDHVPERLLAFPDLAAPELPQFQGKAFIGRAVVYPLALIVLPAIWVAFWRRRHPFPVLSDILLGLPFLFDMVGNALNRSTPWRGGTTRITS